MIALRFRLSATCNSAQQVGRSQLNFWRQAVAYANSPLMARTLLGAVVEMLKRELASRLHRDVVLELETGPATSDQIASISEELRREFPKMTWFAAGGDVKVSWKVSVRVRPDGEADELRQSLARWASKNELLVRKYSVRQRSLWRTA